MSDAIDNQTADKPNTNKPVETLRDGALKVSIFKNESDKGPFFSIKPGKLFTDSEGNTRETNNLTGTEPLRMSKLLDKGYDRVGEFKARLKEPSRDTERDR